jgi:hypothetical protein
MQHVEHDITALQKAHKTEHTSDVQAYKRAGAWQ